MEEDVLGPRAQVLRRRYSRCSKCGRTYSRPVSRTVHKPVPEEARVEEVLLCPSCQQVVPTDQAVVDQEAEQA